jgi:hypothetical protein
MLLLGGFMILVGLLSLIRYRFVRVRQRLSPAAAIRGNNLGSGHFPSYNPSSLGRSVSVLLMLGGGVVLVAGLIG